METHFLAPEKVKLSHKNGALWLKMDGQKVELARPKRSRPLSAPDGWIVLSEKEGSEIGVLKDVAKLDAESRRILRDELERAYQKTLITRILELEREPLSGQVRWRVEIESDEDPAPPVAIPDSKNGPLRLLHRAKTDAEAPTSAQEREFFINGAEDVQTARYPQIFLVDTDGNRYEISNCEALDLASRRLGERFF